MTGDEQRRCTEGFYRGEACGEPVLGSLDVCYDHARRCQMCVEVPDEDRFARPMNPGDECCAACASARAEALRDALGVADARMARPTEGRP